MSGEVARRPVTAAMPSAWERSGGASHAAGSAGAGQVGQPWYPEVLDGPLPQRALVRVAEALATADSSTGLVFSVYIGDLAEPHRGAALDLHGRLADPDRSVLLAISPNQRVLEVVTGAVARSRIRDRDCTLAALSMAAAFSGGDLGGGVVAGLAQLAERARHTRSATR